MCSTSRTFVVDALVRTKRWCPVNLLRVYDPPECDSAGVPLDWKCCRTCGGSGRWCECDRGERTPLNCWSCSNDQCPTCGGHGSLKAAALYELVEAGGRGGTWSPTEQRLIVRCEDCGHPTSEGTWDGHGLADDSGKAAASESAERYLREYDGIPSHPMGLDFYSPCDEGCRHSGPGRWSPNGPIGGAWRERPYPDMMVDVKAMRPTDYLEASWRLVDVRTLGWPHDLSPEKLAVLCLRCWVARAAREALMQ